jgi:RHS repeat-associated protein
VATNTYLANSSLVGQVMFKASTVTRMTTSKQYDYFHPMRYGERKRAFHKRCESPWPRPVTRCCLPLSHGVNRLSSISSTPSNAFAYQYNSANQRTMNQVTSRGVPAAVDVMGDGLATNGVTVNGLTAYRKNEYFRQQLSVTNTSAAVWDSITVAATGQTSVTGHAYVPKAPEDYTYDVDGNLLSDGRWNYTWDGENRLVSMTSLSTAPSGSQLQLLFAYDYQGRRIQKIVCTNNGSSYVGEYTNEYAYDRWNCLAILNPSLSLSNSFMWGSDLSGSLQGAGGVGGLLKVTYYGVATTNCFVAYDGNGNVSALINAADGTTIANYEYGPFGEVIRQSGPMAKVNPFRFSTKYDDDETDLVYYGYRYYNPSTGRWLSRDPLAEKGGLNLYGFVGNHPLTGADPTGLDLADWLNGLSGWIDAIGDGFSWAWGQSGNTVYGPGSLQSQQMSQSAIAGQLRSFYLNKYKGALCKDWGEVTNFKTHFRLFYEFITEWGNGTAEFVGDATGSVSSSIDNVHCNVIASFQFVNTTSVTSLLYGLWPNSWNPTAPGALFSNWTQTYKWNEIFPCNCCYSTGVGSSW